VSLSPYSRPYLIFVIKILSALAPLLLVPQLPLALLSPFFLFHSTTTTPCTSFNFNPPIFFLLFIVLPILSFL
ncbi:hypothetical protein cmbei_6004993, partial [Cryptosporidium meleagridis]